MRKNSLTTNAATTMDRRHFLRAAGVAGAGAVVLAACGSSGSSTGGSLGSTSSGSGGSVTSSDLDLIHQVYGAGGKDAGQGLTLDVGAALFLSGPSQIYGTVMGNAMKLAAKQIKAAGGPTIKFHYRDIESGSAVAAATDVKKFAQQGLGVMLSSNGGVGGAVVPGVGQHKIFTLDGGGGTGVKGLGFQGKPYFWGTSANAPVAAWPGMFDWLVKERPKIKSVYLASWEEGPLSKIAESRFKDELKKHNLKNAGTQFFKIGTTDYSNVLAKIRSASPDMVLLVAYGNDPGIFMKQYVAGGIKSFVMGSEFTEPAAKIAGSAYDDYFFDMEFFPAKKPTSDWGKFFVKTYQAAYGSLPSHWAANYFDNTYELWNLTRDVLKSGGDPNKGPDMEAAMKADPSFPTVYGGNGSTAGVKTCSPETHTLTKAFLGVFSANGDNVKPIATYGIDGANLKIL